MVGVHYPGDLAELRSWFPDDTDYLDDADYLDDTACLDYLEWLDWLDWLTKNGISATSLQPLLGLGSDETAWGMCHKLRTAMGRTSAELLPGVHRVASPAKRRLADTHQSGIATEHLQAYLDEFTFRVNRRPTAAETAAVGREHWQQQHWTAPGARSTPKNYCHDPDTPT